MTRHGYASLRVPHRLFVELRLVGVGVARYGSVSGVCYSDPRDWPNFIVLAVLVLASASQ